MKNRKRTLALLLAAGMTLAVAGCGNEEKPVNNSSEAAETNAVSTETAKTSEVVKEEPKEPVLLEWYYRGNGQQEDTEDVEARVNELLKEYPGLEHVSININCFPSGDYSQQVILAQTSGAQIDILNSVSLGDFGDNVQKGCWMPMDEYISDSLKAELPDWLWEMGSVDGKIYMVPNYQNAYNAAYIAFPKEYMDKYGNYEEMYATLTNWDLSITEKAAALEAYVVACNEGEGGGKYAHVLERSNIAGSLGFAWITPFDNIGDRFTIPDGTDEVVFAYQTEEYKEIWSIYADWYDKGIYSPDGVNTKDADYAYTHMMEPTSCAFSIVEKVGTPEQVAEIYSNAYGFDVVIIPIQQYDYIQNTWGAGGNGISSTCENPEEAALFLEAITTGTEIGKEIYNTMVFGLENLHYVKDANDPERIETLQYTGSQGGVDTTYAGLKWILGNSFYAYKNQAVTDEQYVIAKEMNEHPDTVSSSKIGFVIDKTPVTTQLDQLSAVCKEYETTLRTGAVGVEKFEAYYEEFMAKLEVAGVNEVKEEYQRQLDEWLATR